MSSTTSSFSSCFAVQPFPIYFGGMKRLCSSVGFFADDRKTRSVQGKNALDLDLTNRCRIDMAACVRRSGYRFHLDRDCFEYCVSMAGEVFVCRVVPNDISVNFRGCGGADGFSGS